MDIILNWTGAIGPGAFPRDPETLEALQAAEGRLEAAQLQLDRANEKLQRCQEVLNDLQADFVIFTEPHSESVDVMVSAPP